MSLEFFGGKRTGDLMSRIGTDTDRICTFLSVNLLDFCSDLLMISLTTIMLFSIDPLLALVTLCPFPLIAWLIHGVRSRLRRGFEQGGRALAAHDERAGRHDSRHPRGQSLCPRAARD